MRFAKLAPVVLALGLSLPARAGSTAIVELPGRMNFPLSMPGAGSVVTISLPSSNPLTPTILPASLPSIKTPTIVPLKFPGTPNPLPVRFPAALAVKPLMAPSITDHFSLDWRFLDGGRQDDEPLGSLVPAGNGPRPLAPTGAMNELRDTKEDRGGSIRIDSFTHYGDNGAKVFDGRKESAREVVLPNGKLL